MVLPFQLLVRIGFSYFFCDCVLVVKYMTFQIFLSCVVKGRHGKLMKYHVFLTLGNNKGTVKNRHRSSLWLVRRNVSSGSGSTQILSQKMHLFRPGGLAEVVFGSGRNWNKSSFAFSVCLFGGTVTPPGLCRRWWMGAGKVLLDPSHSRQIPISKPSSQNSPAPHLPSCTSYSSARS